MSNQTLEVEVPREAAINNHFLKFLAEHREGQAITELSEAMAEVTEAAAVPELGRGACGFTATTLTWL